MGAYLDRLHEQADEITRGISAITDRAADEHRDVTDDEQTQVDRDRERLGSLTTAIERYTELETTGDRVTNLRNAVRALPAQRTTRVATEPEEYDLAREFPSIGHYAVTLHRAQALREPDAVAAIERATAHQKLSDNPGIVPRPVLGPVVNLIDATRPFINSVARKPLPAGSFDRPVVTQHVAVGVQTAEKTLTDSQVLQIGKLPTTAKTFAGHLNISRQDIKWTSPGILQIVFEDFAAIYAQTTDEDATAGFLASLSANVPVPISAATPGALSSAMFGAAADAMSAGNGFADTLWVSPDVWAGLGGMPTSQGAQAFPSLSLTGTSGNPMGLKLVVDQHFPGDTMVMGPSRLVEWYEDVDGLMQVAEPDVLGQLVGYAGFGAFLNVAPTAFSVFASGIITP